MGIIRKLVVGALVGAGVEYFAKKKRGGAAAFAEDEPSGNFSKVRDVGPTAMRDNPGSWGKVDEESDASFPASDPPANY